MENQSLANPVTEKDDFDFGVPVSEQGGEGNNNPGEGNEPPASSGNEPAAEYNPMWNWLKEKGIDIPEKVIKKAY